MPLQAGNYSRYQSATADRRDHDVKILNGQLVTERRISLDYQVVVISTGKVSIGHFFCNLRQAFVSAEVGRIDKIDCCAIAANRVDFDLRRSFRHNDGAFLTDKFAGVRKCLAEIARRRCEKFAIWHTRREVVSSAEFKATRMLKSLGCDSNV